MNTIQWALLLAGTLFFIIATWFISLKAKRYHGIFRFFSFESILILVILNYSCWFRNPLQMVQLVSWIFLLGSVLMAGLGFFQFYSRGKPTDHMEETTQLITTGLYKYIRHPLYLSLLLGGFGAMLKDPGPVQIALSIFNAMALYLTAHFEEKEMLNRFGPAYSNYKESTWMFIPYIF